MISLRDISVTYSESQPLRHLNYDFAPMCPTAVMGPSGSGKSTLLRLIAGLQKPTSGNVTINGTPVAPLTWRSAGDPRVALVHQDYRLVPFLSIEDNLRLAAEVRGHNTTEQDIDEALARVGLSDISTDRLPGTLSGGEQQRIAIARALLARVEVLLADEPTGALDEDNTARVAQCLTEVGKSGAVQIVVATHDPSVAATIGHVLQLREGSLSSHVTAS